MNEHKKTKILCNRGYIVYLPCNWNMHGRCGIDTKTCKIVKIVK